MFDDDNYLDYDEIDDLYCDSDDDDIENEKEWENYYHNITNELSDE